MEKKPEIEIVTSPTGRVDGKVPPAPPEDFESLRTMTKDQLKTLGLGPWDESGLMLFPGEWFDFIPVGFDVVDINGHHEKFDPKTSDNDTRFGCLAIGIISHG
jgi:hypothetical protein